MVDINKGYKVPLLPADLPFSEEQQQWLGGFLAGLHSKLLLTQPSASQAQAPVAEKPITIIYGSQTGNAESLAYDCADYAKASGLSPKVMDMDEVKLNDLACAERLIVVCSTYGEGEMPDNGALLWGEISADDAPRFESTHYSVLALGDTGYDDFCLSGKQWDERLSELGGSRIADRLDCDIDYEERAEEWITSVVPVLEGKGGIAVSPATDSETDPVPSRKKSQYSRKKPLLAKLKEKRILTAEASSKEVMHYVFSLSGSGESYDVGDALNIIPCNHPVLVKELLSHFQLQDDAVFSYNGEDMKVEKLFSEELEIRVPTKPFVKELAARSEDDELKALIQGSADALNEFLYGKDTIDLLRQYEKSQFTPEEFVAYLKPIAHRAYSVSSSINAHSEEVHLTVAHVRYSLAGREHSGVCSTYLADILEEGASVKCFFSANQAFSLPKNDSAPVIMVGPGTGIAPFRAFLEERKVREAKGENWLFFGDRNQAKDFLYQSELEAMQVSGLLSRLDLAFSRDQDAKIYVQDRIKEKGAEFFEWLEKGAYFFICGDAVHMAKDVDTTLHEVIAEYGKMDASAATDYVNKLKKEKRYVRDVY